MKHIITAVLLALAVVAGLLLPEVFMDWQDRELETPQLVSVTEPTLECVSKELAQEAEAFTGGEIARRLTLYEAGPAVTVPNGTATTDEVIWATSRAIEFLHMVFEVPPVVYNSGSEYQLAWFEDGTTFPFWTAYVYFNEDCACILQFDGESGAILQCFINPNGHDLAEFFPESFERAANEPNTYFEELIAQRFCDALGYFMGRNDGEKIPVSLDEGSGSVCINFPDDPTASVTATLRVDLMDGIWFNQQ